MDSELLGAFRREVEGQLGRVRELLASLRAGAGGEALGETFGHFHLLRTAAYGLGLTALAQAAAPAEELLRSAHAAGRALLPLETSEVSRALDACLAALHPGRPTPRPEQLESASDELLAVFRDEAEGHVAAMSTALGALTGEGDPLPALLELGRRLHTLKGAAAVVGLTSAAELSHRTEDLVRPWLESGLRPPSRVVRELLEAVDALRDLALADRSASGPAPAPVAAASGLGISPLGSAPLRLVPMRRATADEARAEIGHEVRTPFARIPIARVEQLIGLSSDLLVERTQAENVHAHLTRQLGEATTSLRRLRDLVGFFEKEALATRPEPSPAGEGGAEAASSGFDVLELERFSEAKLAARRLDETTADLEAVAEELRSLSTRLEESIERQRHLVGTVQEGLSKMRAVPFSSLVPGLERAARATARQEGKEVSLRVETTALELDRSLLDELADPLLHLVRNAVAHGLESPEERQAAGKPAAGRITLRARVRGTRAVIEVEDDGRGIDWERVAEVATASARPLPAGADLADPASLLELLFEPGFSTASAVDEVSGRGLGLDAVRDRLERLRGTIAVATFPQIGTRILLEVAMELAVAPALVVRAGGTTLAVPLAAVASIERLPHTGQAITTPLRALELANETLPARRLSEVLGQPAPSPGRVALVIETPTGRSALVVDECVKSSEVAVKPLGALLQGYPGLLGTTVLGDGTLVPILDVENLPLRPTPAHGPTQAAPEPLASREVLIVDDSLSVRRVLSTLLAREGWIPSTARDGIEALDWLRARERPPAVLLLDIEMPRMDGYELTALLREDPAFGSLPIVMLTSRSGAKHRERGIAAGATEYLIKPFQTDVLLDTLRHLVR